MIRGRQTPLKHETHSFMKLKHIFIHSMWRTSSTYVWHTFRRMDEVKGFYEPFHPCLRVMTPGNSQGVNKRNLGHSVGAPYWLEYEELATEEGGIPHFRRNFAVKKYVPMARGLSDEERAYIKLLVENAESHGKQACLGFVRSCMRAGAIRADFGGVHIALVRNPFTQFTSSRQQNFMGGIDSVTQVITSSFVKIGKWYERQCENLEADRVDAVKFAVYYVLSNVTAMIHSDLTVDTDRLAMDLAYRSETCGKIAGLTGISPDFSDCIVAGKTDKSLQDHYVTLNEALISLVGFLRGNHLPGLSGQWNAYPKTMEPEAALSWLDAKRGQSHANT